MVFPPALAANIAAGLGKAGADALKDSGWRKTGAALEGFSNVLGGLGSLYSGDM